MAPRSGNARTSTKRTDAATVRAGRSAMVSETDKSQTAEKMEQRRGRNKDKYSQVEALMVQQDFVRNTTDGQSPSTGKNLSML